MRLGRAAAPLLWLAATLVARPAAAEEPGTYADHHVGVAVWQLGLPAEECGEAAERPCRVVRPLFLAGLAAGASGALPGGSIVGVELHVALALGEVGSGIDAGPRLLVRHAVRPDLDLDVRFGLAVALVQGTGHPYSSGTLGLGLRTSQDVTVEVTGAMLQMAAAGVRGPGYGAMATVGLEEPPVWLWGVEAGLGLLLLPIIGL